MLREDVHILKAGHTECQDDLGPKQTLVTMSAEDVAQTRWRPGTLASHAAVRGPSSEMRAARSLSASSGWESAAMPVCTAAAMSLSCLRPMRAAT